MVKFLTNRPIAVTMTFIAILVLGVVASMQIPVSLLPDTDIPKITVQVTGKNMPARELENTVVRPLRRHLMQTAHLADIRSETRDGSAIIEMDFEFGSDIDFAFIETNEKIDRAIQQLPRDIERPRAIKASATDIPAFYLNLTLNNWEDQKIRRVNTELYPVPQAFVELSNFAFQVIRKRIEQLPEVAMVDMSGMVYPELLVVPVQQKIEALDISIEAMEQAIASNHLSLGNLVIRDGQYQYNVRFSSTLRTKREIEEVYLKVDNRLFQLKDLAEVIEHPQPRAGLVSSDGQDALSLAIIKRSDAQMGTLKETLNALITHLEQDYPHIQFTVTRDQTQLLEYSINNLAQGLAWSAVLAFLVMFFFLKDFQSPLLIGITIPTALLVSLLFFHLLGISVNIISLSGLVLGVGMMVDNSIIVIDNIGQHRDMGKPLNAACVHGVNEIFRPLLSSVLTTCAVFIPLIFLSGISGALFYDQAMAVAIGLVSSLIISITLLPVYYHLLYKKKRFHGLNKMLQWINRWNYEGWYDRGFAWVMRQQVAAWCVLALLLVGTFFLYERLPVSRLPSFIQNELVLHIDWGTPVTLEENQDRVGQLTHQINAQLEQKTSFVGKQHFLLDKAADMSTSEALVYLRVKEHEELLSIRRYITDWINFHYRGAIYEFRNPGNIFDVLFADNQPAIEARLRATNDYGHEYGKFLGRTLTSLQEKLTDNTIPEIEWQEQIVLEADPVRLMTYKVAPEVIHKHLKSAFSENEVLLLADNQYFVPVVIGRNRQNLQEILASLAVPNENGEQIYLRNLLTWKKDADLKTIIAGQQGEYYPVPFEKIPDEEVSTLENAVRAVLNQDKLFEVSFSGSYYESRELIRDMIFILGISLLLLYFILAAQFESLKLPLIVLFEVPIDIFGAFFMLWLFGAGINLMSMIGIIVMSGIIINDSILKIDTINQLRKDGLGLIRALHVAGRRRLKPILMTSLTTILALMPFLFSSGMGADLQKPLALSITGGMIVGTLVSVYVIPLMYYYLAGKK